MQVAVVSSGSPKGQHISSPCVISGQQSRKDTHRPEELALAISRLECSEQDGFLRPETHQRWNAGQSQRPDQKGQLHSRHFFTQTTHSADILLPVQGVNHHASGQEEQSLEKCVAHQVKNGRTVSANTCRHKHVAELGHGRIGQNAF